MTGRRGIALVTALMVAALLAVLVGGVLLLFLPDYYAHRRQQQAIQALWNARAGMERWLALGTLPEPDLATGQRVWSVRPGSSTERCVVFWRGRDLCFEGSSGTVRRRLVLLNRHPDRVKEETP
ncbi:MAG: hypothetical protein AB1758_17970 [Candidatus Eremiobacterota bacterium]